VTKKVLIVEDQDDVREVVRITLELEDFAIHEAPDGPSGLQQAARLRPDLVLLDVMMPGGIDGLQVCQRIKHDPQLKRTRVVMLTARDQPADRKAAAQAGADHYLVKPFSPNELLDTVNRLLR
jgi:DNA-binding response OmpR family regulator